MKNQFKKLFSLILFALISISCLAQTWQQPKVTVIPGTNGLANGMTIIQFSSPDPSRHFQYTAHFISQRLAGDVTIADIDSRYPGCGTGATANTPTDVCTIYLALLCPGDVYLFYLSAYPIDNSPKTNSDVFTFTNSGTQLFPQTLGSMAYCTVNNAPPAPTTISQTVPTTSLAAPITTPTTKVKHGNH